LHKNKKGVAKQMTERGTNVLNELEVAQGEEGVVVGIESPVIEELEKAKTFLAVGAGGWGVAKYVLTRLFDK
jgi:hypothetical protein